MRLQAIRLENVRRFTDPVEITGIGPGLNVLCEPNEHGKSTVLDALHALFFKDRNSWDKEVRGLAPHAGGDPEVGVEAAIGEGVFRIEKRWSKNRKGEARVYAEGRLFKQADDAEAWLADALKAPKDGGPAGLLWVRQGLAGLDASEGLARRNLLSSVTGEVEAMTGGRRMDAVRDLCGAELARYLTPTGRPRADGPLKRREKEAADLEARRAELARKAAALRDDLETRRTLRRELAALEDPGEDAGRRARLAAAEAAHGEAMRHAEAFEQAQEAERSKRAEMEHAAARLEALEAALAEAAAAAAALEEHTGEAAGARERQRRAEALWNEAAAAHEVARAQTEAAADLARRVLRARGAAAAAERRKELSGQLEQATALRAAGEQAAAEAKIGIAERVLEELERLAQDVVLLQRARDSEAAALTMEYAAGRCAGVAIAGRPLPGGERVAIPDGASLEVEGIGRLTIHPGRGADRGGLAAAEAELAQALAAAGVDSLEDAQASARRRAEAEARRRDAEAGLKAVAPDGLEALRAKIAALPEPVADAAALPDAEDALFAETAAKRALADAGAALEAARSARDLARTVVARAAAVVESASARTERAAAPLAGIEDADAERARRQRALAELRSALDAAIRQRETIEATAPDLIDANAKLERARSVVRRADVDRQRIRDQLLRLDTVIDMHAADAVEEELADVEARLEVARRRLAGVELEVEVLRKLDAALETARATARERYVEPVLTELRPLLELLWPEAELRFDADAVLPNALVRAGTAEDFDILSGGTQEQIALLVRLAFARLLAKAGKPAPVILDDAIVYTDDERIERMFDALTRQAQDLQILVFSCRQKSFRDLGGRSLTIAPERAMLQAAE